MEMHQVRYFLAVADELNFTRAAEKCHVAQPSLTRAIKLLEEELGGVLFHRERANTHLSELGRMVMPHLAQVWSQTQATKTLAEGFGKLTRTKLRLGVMCTIAPDQLIELFVSFQFHHPDVDLEIVDASARDLHGRLMAGDLEVALYCAMGALADERTHLMPLFREQMMIVLKRDHSLASNNAVRVKDLDGLNYLNRVNCEFIGHLAPHLEEQGVSSKTVYRSERDDWILAMVAAGLGYGFMPASCIAHPGIIARPLIAPEFWREVNLVTVRGRPHSPAVGALVHEVMRANWLGQKAIAARQAANLTDYLPRQPSAVFTS
jgi:LysR family transcriptional regulator, hydrogen peroxide-inducible genes activator